MTLAERAGLGSCGRTRWRTGRTQPATGCVARAAVQARCAAGSPLLRRSDTRSSPVELDRAWVAAQHNGQALLHRVDSEIGLTATDLATLDDWLQDVSETS